MCSYISSERVPKKLNSLNISHAKLHYEKILVHLLKVDPLIKSAKESTIKTGLCCIFYSFFKIEKKGPPLGLVVGRWLHAIIAPQ